MNGQNLPSSDSLLFFRSFIGMHNEIPKSFYRQDLIADDTTKKIFQRKAVDEKAINVGFFTEKSIESNRSDNKIVQQNTDWITLIFLFCAILFAIIKYSFGQRLKMILNATHANRNVNQLIREGAITHERISLLLYIIFFSSISLFLLLGYKIIFSNNIWPAHSFILFLKIFGILIGFHFFKIFLFKLVGSVFKTFEFSSNYILNIHIFNHLTGIVLLPLIIIIVYSDSQPTFYFTSVIFLLIIIYRFIRNLALSKTSGNFTILNLFFYLCTLEILPLLIGIKVVSLLVVTH